MNNETKILSDEQMRLVMVMQPAFSDDTNYAHMIRMGRAVENAVAVSAFSMAAALDLIVRRLQADIDSGSRPDQWSMEAMVKKAHAALPDGWVIGAG